MINASDFAIVCEQRDKAIADRDATLDARDAIWAELKAVRSERDVFEQTHNTLHIERDNAIASRDAATAKVTALEAELATARESATMHRAAFDAVRQTMLAVLAEVVPIARRVKKKRTTKAERQKLRALEDMLAKAAEAKMEES